MVLGSGSVKSINRPSCGIDVGSNVEYGFPSWISGGTDALSKPHTGTTNGLRHGTQMTQYGVLRREELVTVCVVLADAGIACQALARNQNVHVGTPCHSIVAPSLLIVYELFT